MKHIYLLFFFLCGSFAALAQDSAVNDVKWNFSADKSANSQYILTFKAAISPGWKLFSTTAKDDELNTRIIFDSATTASNQFGAIDEQGALLVAKEPLLDNMETRSFEGDATFNIPVTVVSAGKNIRGAIMYMAMKGDEVTGPTEVPFVFSIDASGNIAAKAGGLQSSAEASARLTRKAIDINNPVNNCGGTGLEESGGKGLWGIFILGFFGGLIGLLTPCVFPMIPLTVSFFTKSSQDR
ncbi:MAG: cytochrome C biogenesis protein, partial [Chitinophagaceae bacterium]